MVRNQLIIGLRTRYARVLGIAQTGEYVGDDLVHLAAVIRMFSPDEDLSAIKPKRPYRGKGSTWMRDALNILRTANEPKTAVELARAIAALHGVTDRQAYKSICCSLHLTLDDLSGVVRVSDSPKRWWMGAAGIGSNSANM
jgi:hypothetical protein